MPIITLIVFDCYAPPVIRSGGWMEEEVIALIRLSMTTAKPMPRFLVIVRDQHRPSTRLQRIIQTMTKKDVFVEYHKPMIGGDKPSIILKSVVEFTAHPSKDPLFAIVYVHDALSPVDYSYLWRNLKSHRDEHGLEPYPFLQLNLSLSRETDQKVQDDALIEKLSTLAEAAKK